MNVKNLVECYKDFLGSEGLSSHSIKLYLSDIGIFLNSMEIKHSSPARVLASTKENNVRKYISSGDASPRTQRRRYSSLKHFFNYCILEEVTGTNPADNIELPQIAEECPGFITSKEYGILMDSIPTQVESPLPQFLNRRDRSIINWLYNDGLTPGDVKNARYKDFIIQSNLIEAVSVDRSGKGVEIPLSKTSLNEMTFYEGAFFKYFSKHISDNPNKEYYRNRHGSGLSARRMRWKLSLWGNEILKRDDINPRTIHNGSIVRLLQEGMEINDIVELTGASSMHVHRLKKYLF